MNSIDNLKFPKETMLELVQLDSGEIVLRPVITDEHQEDDEKDPLVSIQFSHKIQEMLGDDLHGVGQHMIHSALQLLMQQQMAHWHAQVVDEEPARFS